MKRFALAVQGTASLGGMVAGENGLWLARLLQAQGQSLETLQFLPDSTGDLRDFLRRWAGQADVLVLSCEETPSGSRKCLAALADLLDLPWEERDGISAFSRKGGKALEGPGGTAGLRLAFGGSVILVLPGEPAAFRKLASSELARETSSGEPAFVRIIGLSQRQVRERLSLLPGCSRIPLSPSPNETTLLLQDAEGPNAEKDIRSAFAGDCLPPGVGSLARAVLQESGRVGISLAAAESCTGGLIGAELTGPPGASASFLGSAVCYANEAKTNILGVPPAVLETRGAVSEECALAMARGARHIYGSGLAVSVTGIAGPEGGSPQKPVGTVWFGLSWEGGGRAFVRHFQGMARDGIRMWTVAVALEALWRYLREVDVP